MAEKLMPDFECKAPQFVDFDATEPSFVDDYFNGRVSLWSRDNTEVSNIVTGLSDNGDKVNGRSENCKTPSNLPIETIKKDYRVPSTTTPSSPFPNSQTPSHESPELEYTRPWLNKTCSSLISAMDALQLSSANNRISLTPCNNRNFNACMETSTPFITVKEKSKTRFVETKKHHPADDPKTPECREVQSTSIITEVELQEVQNAEIITQVECGEDVEQKSAKFGENHGEEDQDDNLQHATAAEGSSDQIVPVIALTNSNNDENTQIDMIVDKSVPKEVAENFFNDSAKNTENLGENLPESVEDLGSDEQFGNAAVELLKFDSHVDATEQKEENGRSTKTRKTGVLVTKARRQSQKFRRRSGKFVSMAEAILKFQKGTPKRFYSTKRMMKSGPSQAVVQSSRKVTHATSPVLLCKSRCKRTIATNKQEEETTEKNTAKRIGTSKKIAQAAPSSFGTRKNEIRDKSESRKKLTTKNSAETISATGTMSTKAETLPGESENITKAKSEAMPMKSTSLTTKTKSSSRLATKLAKSSSELIPKTTKKTGGPTLKTDAEKIDPEATKNLQTKAKTKSTCALSFEERNKLLLKKREEFAKRIIEQEKQTRIFHARPAPTFKPITVHGSSMENLKTQRNHKNVKSPRTGNLNCPMENQENRPPSKNLHGSSTENLKIEHDQQNPKTPRIGNTSCSLENQENMPLLRTVERCKKRRVFDAEIKKREDEEEAQRKEEEIERLETMKNQDKELRKTMELKAKPMPTFKHPQIAKSRKPLTDPQSPAWSRKTKR